MQHTSESIREFSNALHHRLAQTSVLIVFPTVSTACKPLPEESAPKESVVAYASNSRA